MNSFYITLPSNVYSDNFDNTVANFKTKLANRINLSGEWEVGLASISYSLSWFNLPNDEYIKFYYFHKGKKAVTIDVFVPKNQYMNKQALIDAINNAITEAQTKANTADNKKIRYFNDNNVQKSAKHSELIPGKSYFDQDSRDRSAKKFFGPNVWGVHEVAEFVKIRDEILNYKPKKTELQTNIDPKLLTDIILPKLLIDQVAQYICFETKKYKGSYIIPDISYNLCRMLGFDKFELDEHLLEYLRINQEKFDKLDTNAKKDAYIPTEDNYYKTALWSTMPVDLDSRFHTLFVYCDIIEPNYVGDSYTQLLRFVEVPNNVEFGSQVMLNYVDTHYFPLLHNNFDSIEIYLTDDTGQKIPFSFGRTTVLLHFRKIINDNFNYKKLI